MARSFGSLGDFFPETDIRCRIRGCNNVWRFSGEDALRNVAHGKPARPERMCDECYAEFLALSDREVPCSRAGCEGTWTWTRFQQLEAKRQGHHEPPRRLCPACKSEMDRIADRQVACRVKGCDNTWTWSARDQVSAGDRPPPRRYCERCFSALRQLADKEVPCRIRGCTRSWTWTPYQQLEYLAAGKSLDVPPRRMCEACFARFRELADVEKPCRVKGCEHTWIFTAYEQLETELAAPEGSPPEMPTRMCPQCYEFFSKAVDREVPCSNRGCSNTWTFSRAMQLRLWKKGVEGLPRRMCAQCMDRLKALQNVPLQCMVPGCEKTWTYTPREQLRDALAGRDRPTPKRCAACEAFLSTHEPEEVPCMHCGTRMHWSVYEQLLSALGTFVKPVRCPDCAEQALALQTPAPPERPEHHHLVRIPAAGRWNADERIRDWPPHMTYEVIERVEKADLRLVAIGDDLTWSAEDVSQSWPYLLEARLNQLTAGRLSVAVVNAGIPRCTTRQGVMRFARDVVPFAPDVVLFSFAFGDSRVFGSGEGGRWRYNAEPDSIEDSLELFVQQLAGSGCRALYWTANPVFPHESERAGQPGADSGQWAKVQQESLDHCLRQARQVCLRHALPTVDLRSRFEVNGSRSAHKWMSSWYMHNELGAANIATWLADFLQHGGLLDTALKPGAEGES